MLICPNLSNKDVAREFNELKSALMAADPKHGEAMAYLVWSLNNGNAIDKAPNGAESLLFKSLVDYYEGNRSKAIVAKAKTYSTNFLKWFGNWTGEKDALPEIRKQNPYSSEITIGKASPDYDSADMNGAGAMFAIRKNGEYIGSIAVNAYYRKGGNIEPWGEKDTNYVSMSSVGDAVEIEKEFRGKGYGKAAYFEFAKLMADLGYILRSAPSKSRTPASTRVWESLVRDGYAKRVGDRYEFINWFGDQGRFKTTDTKNNLFTPSGEINWDYFELLLDLYHNNQPDSMFSHGRYTLATRPENHFTGEKNTLNHIKFVTQSMLNLLEGKYDMDLPFVSEARSSLQNQKDLMILAAMFHDVAKPYRHGDIHGWESADILRDLLGVDYNNRVAEWAVRHHMPMPFSHKAEFSLSNPEAIEVAKNIARDARRIGIDANTAINAFVLINAADVINGRELDVDDNWAKKAGEEGLKKYGGDISVKNVLSVELKEKVALLKKAFDEIKDEDFGDTVYNYSHQERFDYQAFPEGGREDKKLPYLNNTEYTGVSKVVDENGEPLVVWHGSNSYGFETFDVSKSDDKISLFATDSEFIASTYTDFLKIYSDLVKNRLNTPDFIRAIKNKDWDTAKRIVRSIYDNSVSIELQVYMSGSYGIYTYLSAAKISEEERNSLLSEASDDEERIKRHYFLRVKTKPTGDVVLTLRDGNDDGGRFIDTSIIFEGSPEQLLESIQKDTKTYALFLNIKNPLILDKQVGEFGAINNWNNLDFSNSGVQTDDVTIWGEKTGRKKRITRTRDVAKYAKDNGYDGVLFGEIIDHGGYSGDRKLNPVTDKDIVYEYFHEDEDSYTGMNIYKSNVFIAFDPNQLKHIDNRDGEWTGPNIYHNLRGVDSSNEVREELLFSGAIKKSFNGGYELVNQPWAIQQVRDVCKQYGMLASTFVTPSGKIKISFVTHEGSLPKISADKIPQSVRLDPTASTIEELTKEGHAISELVSFLKEKFPQLEVEYIFPSQLDEKRFEGIDKNTNSFVKGNRVYLIRGRVTSEIAAEELLHPLVYTIANQNWNLFQDFITEAKKQFPKLASQIEDNYTNARGFNEFNRQLELVTQVLARHVNKKFNAGEKGSKLSKLIDQMFNYIGSTIRQFINKFKGNDNDFNDIRKMTLSELADIILAEDSTFKVYTTEEIQHNLSNRLQAAQDEANRIIVRMNVLYKQYEKMKSKTPSQERLANQIFETLNKLKQHRDISAVQIALDQARLTLGQYDPTTGGPAQISSIYKYLYDAMLNGFAGVSAQSLVDMYRNSIKFYKDLIENIPSEQAIDLTRDDKNAIADLKSLIDDHIMPIWTQAIMQVGDQIVDDQIDNEVFSSDENKEDMKKVAKDWLHKNLMYGDITAVTSYVYNYSNSSNPIIKLAFHLIQQAELKTLEEVHQIAPKLMRAYQRANKGSRSFTPGWQSMMMEYDDKGIPTGNFVRELNYGLYQKDLKEFLEDLNKRFVDTYGFTYVVDDTGAVTNSLTGEFAEDEEWGTNGEMPRYIEYLREIEYFKADRVHRRYQPKYYLERLSRPYDGTVDPMDPKFAGTKLNHGLSPKTLARYTYYQSNINYYLNKCQDPDTGLIYPERLSYDDQLSLDRWRERMDKFTSIFNDDGSYKIGEDLKMAYEVRAWLKWIGEFTDSDVFQDQFNTELQNIKNESVSTSNPRLYNDFVKYNSHVGINPDFIKQTVGDMRSAKTDTDTSFRGKLLRASLLGMVNNPHIFGRELQKMINNPLFWLQCKTADLAIEDANDPDNVSGWDKAQVEAFQENFYQKDILYVDEYGFYIDENGNKVNSADPSAKALEDAGKLLTFRSYLINRYTDEALRTGQVAGLIDESTGMPIDFSGLTQSQIRSQIHSLLSYKKTYWDEDGNVDRIEDTPLTIFSVLAPVKDKFFNKRTGRNEPTVILVGDSRFKDSHSSLLTSSDKYDPNSGIAEVPNKDYADGRYDNSEAYNKVMKDDSVKELYELLIQTMLDMQSIYSTNRKFNYKVPQINARTSALLSRLLKRGYSVKSIQGLWNSMTSIEENDELLRTKQDYFVGVDGHVANDVPLKFIRDLKNKEDLSTDLVSTVIMFADMALNYKNKSEIDSKLKILRYNMDKDIRDVYESKIKPKSEQSAKNNDNSMLMFDSMMDVSMYGNKFGNTDEGGPGKVRVALHKTADAFQSLESSAMLGLNMFSMSVGFADSITRIFSESVAGKYMTIGDCLWALGKVLWYTPACIKNMFNPVANNKMTALMQMNGISKGTFGTYTKADWGKGRKLLGNILMGGWSMLDWMANALLMTAFYHNCRFFEGIVENGVQLIKPGFYTKYELQLEFLRIGKTKREASKARLDFGNILNVTEYKKLDKDGNVVKGKIHGRITLWDAYQFAPYYKDENGDVKKAYGTVEILKEYEPFVTQRVKTNIATKTKKRGALYNGMNPDNDIPRWKRDVIGRLAGALRGWIVQQFQHLVAGGTDSIARDFTTEEVIETNSSGTRKKTRMVKNKLTDELRSRRMAWDYETGTPQDQILIGLWRSFKTLYREASQTLLLKPRTAKLSEVEKYAWTDTIIFLSMLAMMMVGWTYVHDDAREVKKPTSRKEAGPASMWNPVDYYEYVRDVYIPNQYWKLAVDDIYFRTVEAKISNINPQQVLDIVSALTALKSGLDDQLGVIGLGMDVINGENTDEVLKLGAYKFYTKGERSLYRAVGPAKNLHTFLTYYGATNNLRWYTNKFGTFYRAFGYDFKAKDKGASLKQQQGFQSGNFSGGGFSSGSFSSGGF